MRDYSKELIEFIQKSPSCYHVVENIAQTLCRQGFQELSEGERWQLSKGGSYFVRRITYHSLVQCNERFDPSFSGCHWCRF